MAKRPPEKYNPGDLDRTRSNLGELSREEADRMKEILGGEIGIERTDDELLHKYEDIRKMSASKTSGGRNAGGGSSGTVISSDSRSGTDLHGSGQKSSESFRELHKSALTAYTGHYISRKSHKNRLSYFERIKIDRMAARPEHKIKTRSAVVSAYLSFLFKNRDTVNPEFIMESENFFYRHIESLVTDLKAMLKMVRPSIFKNYINPYYRELLKILISWNLEELSSLMSDLQKAPRNREIQDCGRLCTVIYKPIISVGHIDTKHLYAAVDRLFQVLIILFRDEPDELISIKNYYLDVKDKIKIVFRDVAFTCYPLLLKLTGVKFHYYREFMIKNRSMILKFLNVDENKLVIPPDSLQELGKKQYSLNHLKKKLDKEKEEQLAAMKQANQDRK